MQASRNESPRRPLSAGGAAKRAPRRGPCYRERAVVVRRAVERRAVERRAVARRAVERAAVPDLRAVVFRAVPDFRAAGLRAVVLRAVALRAVVALRVVALRVVALRAGLEDRPPPDTAFSASLASLRAVFNHEALPLRRFAGNFLICFSMESRVVP